MTKHNHSSRKCALFCHWGFAGSFHISCALLFSLAGKQMWRPEHQLLERDPLTEHAFESALLT